MLIKVKHFLIRHRENRLVKRAMAAFFSCSRCLFVVLPPKASFFLITLSRLFDRRISYFLASDFGLVFLKKKALPSGYNLTSALTASLPLQAAGTLVRLGAFQQANEWLANSDPTLRSDENFLMLALDYLDWGEFEQAKAVLNLCSEFNPVTPELLRYKGFIALLDGREELASSCLTQYAEVAPAGWCSHQNIAARYPDEYLPLATDKNAGERGLLFDAYNFLGQRVTRVGRGELGASLYGRALELQSQLMLEPPVLSEELKLWLEKEKISFENVSILPWEWVTQIGHLGMLEILFRMRDLGWWSGPAVILAPPGKAANKAMLSLFEKQARIVVAGVNVNESLAQELFSLQRYRGINFNAWKFATGEVVPWQQAGARLMRQWEIEQRAYPLRQAFDEGPGNSKLLNDQIAAIKSEWDMKPDDWYVCLHVRDAGFYGELQGFGQTHRNGGDLETYLAAVRYITDQGGWVIKLGGSKAPQLPQMARVVDYARSKVKSELLDLHLIRHARFFIGTTSGLTNVAISFNVPCALVNCASPDAQLWGSRVRFAFKPIISSTGEPLSQLQITSTPWRWRVFNVEVLRRYDAFIKNNSADEILETVKEVHSLAEGKPEIYMKNFTAANNLLACWKSSLAFPEFYGAALPSIYYLKKYEKTFLTNLERLQIND